VKLFIGSHSSGMAGPIDYYEAYLLRNGHDVLKLSHPLDNYDGKKTTFTLNGRTVSARTRKGMGALSLAVDLLISIGKILSNRFDIYVGANNFDTISAIVCRAIFRKRIHQIIYFGSDFSEDRYSNTLMNRIYYLFESAALKKSDLVVSNTHRAHNKRMEIGLTPDKGVVVPNGVYLKSPVFRDKEIRKDHFIFIGSVTKEHGLYDLIEAIAPAIKQLVIIGQGDDWERTVKLAKDKGVPLELHHNKDHEYVIRYLQSFNGIGLAPYNLKSKWTYYCSPLKINEYLACGVPVITSKVPEIASIVEDQRLGVAYDRLDTNTIVNLIKAYDTSNFAERASKFYQHYNYNSLYSKIHF
jgi:glycosyltransferase involved in cell wall biosynthesis